MILQHCQLLRLLLNIFTLPNCYAQISSSPSGIAFRFTQPQSPTRKDLAEQFCQANHRLAEALHQRVALVEGQCQAGCSWAITLNQPEPMRLEILSLHIAYISSFLDLKLGLSTAQFCILTNTFLLQVRELQTQSLFFFFEMGKFSSSLVAGCTLKFLVDIGELHLQTKDLSTRFSPLR